MSLISNEYQELVLDEVASYKGITHPVKAGFWERLLRRRLPISSLHPNPDDEFSNPDVGPSYSIIAEYITQWKRFRESRQAAPGDKITVEKMSVGGYMLLDGHHRWYAARRVGIETLRVSIVNVTPIEEVILAMQRSKGRLCASLDLDEVLLTDSSAADSALPAVLRRFQKKALRKNAAMLVRELKSLGFDVWVYTGSFVNDSDIRKLFRFLGVKADGIVSGLKNESARAKLRKAFTEKYELSVHIDLEGVICVNTKTKQYESADITGEWATGAVSALKGLESIRNYSK